MHGKGFRELNFLSYTYVYILLLPEKLHRTLKLKSPRLPASESREVEDTGTAAQGFVMEIAVPIPGLTTLENLHFRTRLFYHSPTERTLSHLRLMTIPSF